MGSPPTVSGEARGRGRSQPMAALLALQRSLIATARPHTPLSPAIGPQGPRAHPRRWAASPGRGRGTGRTPGSSSLRLRTRGRCCSGTPLAPVPPSTQSWVRAAPGTAVLMLPETRPSFPVLLLCAPGAPPTPAAGGAQSLSQPTQTRPRCRRRHTFPAPPCSAAGWGSRAHAACRCAPIQPRPPPPCGCVTFPERRPQRRPRPE